MGWTTEGLGGGLISRQREQGVESWGPKLTIKRNPIDRRGAEEAGNCLDSKREASAVESLFSFVAELMIEVSTTPSRRATGTFLA